MASPLPDQLRGIHTLAVDDHADTLDLYEQVLTSAGGFVTFARSPADALARCVKFIPDVVVTDLTFGGLKRDGLWLLEELRKQPALAAVPVVAVTGRVVDAAWRHQHTFDAVLIKPFEPRQLVELVGTLGRRRDRRRDKRGRG